MESYDKTAYQVLLKNMDLLCSVMDARDILTVAHQRQLITMEEKTLIEREESLGAGMRKMLTVLMEKTVGSVFQLFLEVLENHSDELKMWAQYLRDDYEIEQQDRMEDRPKSKKKRSLERSALSETDLLESLERRTSQDITDSSRQKGSSTVSLEYQHLVDLSSIIDRKVSNTKEMERKKRYSLPDNVLDTPEKTLLNEFKASKGRTVKEIFALLKSYENYCVLKDVRDSNMRSLLHIACQIMNFIIVKHLIETYEFNPNLQDEYGNTALHVACLSEKTQIVMYLINKSNCNPNIRNRDGSTPFHIAARNQSVVIVKYLMAMPQLDGNVKDITGKTALEIIEVDPKLAPNLESLKAVITSDKQDDKKNRKLPVAGESVKTRSVPKLTRSSNIEVAIPDDDECKLTDVIATLDDKYSLHQSKSPDAERNRVCCCCYGKKTKTLTKAKKTSHCSAIKIVRFCMMFKTVFYLLLGILLAAAIVGILAYYLAMEN